MVQIFAKRFYGFDPQTWPVCSFSKRGNRDRLLDSYRVGDLLLWIGTKTPPTAKRDQGALLGLATLWPIEVSTMDHVERDARGPLVKPETWPFAIPIAEAWRLVDRPLLTDVLKKQLPFGATIRAIKLDAEDTAAVLQLDKERVSIQEDRIVETTTENLNSLAMRTSHRRGPEPTSHSGRVDRNVEQSAATYLLRFGSRNCWKVGCSMHLVQRLKQINKHVPSEVLDERWVLVNKKNWPNMKSAFAMEQRLLDRLPTSEGERAICSEAAIDEAWREESRSEILY